MLIDILFCLTIVLALWKGYSQGFILGLFSLVAIFIGLAAALKLSAVVAGYLGHSTKSAGPWLPLLSFLIVFIAVLILVRLAAKALESSVKLVLLGWLNKLGGMICYVLLYAMIFSILLFYSEKMQWIGNEGILASRVYSYIAPWGPRSIGMLGQLIPWFSDLFHQLEDFFGKVAHDLPTS
jgi:membrane protein required for colicin V production